VAQLPISADEPQVEHTLDTQPELAWRVAIYPGNRNRFRQALAVHAAAPAP
jgi:hypothetical protein